MTHAAIRSERPDFQPPLVYFCPCRYPKTYQLPASLFTLGLGMAVTVAPLTTTVMNAAGADLAGVASGVNNAVARAAGLLAIATFGIVMAQVFDARLAASLRELSLAPSLIDAVTQQHQRLGGIVVPLGTGGADTIAVHQAIGSAFVAGFRWVMALCTGLALLSALCAAWLIGRAERVEHKEPFE